MARIQRIVHLLDLWAIWKVRDESGGLGYPKQSAFTREACQSGYRESQTPVMGHEEADTDMAIQAMAQVKPVHHETLMLHYIGGRRQPIMGIKDLANRFGVRPESIHARLAECDRFIAGWLDDRVEAAKRVPYSFVHTSAQAADVD